MKKQFYQGSAILLAFFLIAMNGFSQTQNLLPAGKYLLKIQATRFDRRDLAGQPEHSLVVIIVRNGSSIAIQTDVSKADISGHFGQVSTSPMEGTPVSFSINGTNNWLSLKARTSGADTQNGSFVFVPNTNGTQPVAAIPENIPNSTCGTFTLTPYSDKVQAVADASKTKEIYNSAEPWWTAFKKWMMGEGF